ncbi:MAG: STAS domain-containing protein [Acidobacteriota bacterium]
MTRTSTVDGGLIYELHGRLDSETSIQAEKELEELLRCGCTVLALDLRQLVFVSSAGLRVFLAVTKKLRMAGGEVVFFGPQGNVLEVLNISGFSRILNVQEKYSAAQ